MEHFVKKCSIKVWLTSIHLRSRQTFSLFRLTIGCWWRSGYRWWAGRSGNSQVLELFISNNCKYSFEYHAITHTTPIKIHIVVIYRPPGQLGSFVEDLDVLLSSFPEDFIPLFQRFQYSSREAVCNGLYLSPSLFQSQMARRHRYS